jgi:hypothetical protein
MLLGWTAVGRLINGRRGTHAGPSGGGVSVDTKERVVRTVAGIRLSEMAFGRVAAPPCNEVRN